MIDRDLFLAQQYQREMLEKANQARLIRTYKNGSQPNLWDYALLRAGDALITLGQKLRSASDYNNLPDLSKECA